MMGDVGDPTQPAYQELLDKATKSFRKVFLLAGRCEYSQKSEDTDVFLEKLAQCYPNVHYMQRSSVMLRPDLIVAGSTLRLHPADSRYGTGMTHAADEMRTKRLEDGRKILYMSYGCPDREHLRLLRPVTGLRVFVCMNKDRDPPVRVIEI